MINKILAAFGFAFLVYTLAIAPPVHAVVPAQNEAGPEILTLSGSTLQVATFSGAEVPVRNFLSDADVLKIGDRNGEEFYSVGAVPRGAHVTVLDGPEDAPYSLDVGYEILFFPDGVFEVSILKEPIGDVRREVQTILAGRLGLAKDTLCELLIGVRVDVQGVLAGRYIGLPGCEGATVLPGD